MRNQLTDIMEKDIIECSTSPWGARTLLVERPGWSYRLFNYRDLNRSSRVEPNPFPNVEETLSLLGSVKCYTGVDMAPGAGAIRWNPVTKQKRLSIHPMVITNRRECQWV